MASATYVFSSGTILSAEVNRNFGELQDQFLTNTGTAHNHNGTNSKKVDISKITGGVVQSARGSTASTSFVEVGSVQFNANDFANGDMIEVVVVQRNSNTGGGDERILITGSGLETGTVNINTACGDTNVGMATAFITSGSDDNHASWWSIVTPGITPFEPIGYGAVEQNIGTNWIQTAFCLRLQCLAASGSFYWQWFIRKIPIGQNCVIR